MIISKLIGGLGNQMFQYAAGLALAKHHDTELLLDISELSAQASGAYTKRNYELDNFMLQVGFANSEHLVFFDEQSGRLSRVINRILIPKKNKIKFFETGHNFHSNFFKLPVHTSLIGFWQCEKYFIQIRERLLKDFVVKGNIPDYIKEMQTRVINANSVSVHVRRGDYVTLKSANEFHGTCSIEYYQKAVKYISESTYKPEVYVFSDDIAWCKENLKLGVETNYVEHSYSAAWDILLMSCCKHNIIANSSFSWWGAWLNQNLDKKVILPEFWFAKTKSEQTGIVCKGWTIIK